MGIRENEAIYLPEVMLDLETWGKPNLTTCPAFFAIGAVRFSTQPPEIFLPRLVDDHGVEIIGSTQTSDWFYSLVDMRSTKVSGLEFDADTIYWWFNQPPEAQEELRRSGESGLSLLKVLTEFSAWLENGAKFWHSLGSEIGFWDHHEYRIWAHGEDFDIPILRSAYLNSGIALPKWERHCFRDTRTLFSVTPGFDQATFFPSTPVEHHALYDAWRQAVAVQRCCQQLHECSLNFSCSQLFKDDKP